MPSTFQPQISELVKHSRGKDSSLSSGIAKNEKNNSNKENSNKINNKESKNVNNLSPQKRVLGSLSAAHLNLQSPAAASHNTKHVPTTPSVNLPTKPGTDDSVSPPVTRSTTLDAKLASYSSPLNLSTRPSVKQEPYSPAFNHSTKLSDNSSENSVKTGAVGADDFKKPGTANTKDAKHAGTTNIKDVQKTGAVGINNTRKTGVHSSNTALKQTSFNTINPNIIDPSASLHQMSPEVINPLIEDPVIAKTKTSKNNKKEKTDKKEKNETTNLNIDNGENDKDNQPKPVPYTLQEYVPVSTPLVKTESEPGPSPKRKRAATKTRYRKSKRKASKRKKMDDDDAYCDTDEDDDDDGHDKNSRAAAIRYRPRRWTESDDNKVAFLREYGNLKWNEVTEFIKGRHTPQAVQMRYLRSLKRRNDKITPTEEANLRRLVVEDYESRFRRLSTAMGPSFTPIRIQKVFMAQSGMQSMLESQKKWTQDEISQLIDDAGGDFDEFHVPTRSDELPPLAAEHMKDKYTRSYEELVSMYIGGKPENMTSLCEEEGKRLMSK